MRRKKNIKRELRPDPIYGSFLVSQFTKALMYGAKKDENPVAVLEAAVNNVAPALEIRPRRVGGATYQVPHEVSPKRRLSLALRWLIAASRSKKGKPMSARLA